MKIIFWPFLMLWALVGFIFSLTGRFIAMIAGIALMAAGGVLTVTIIGALVGIPLMMAGGALFLRALF